MPVALKMAQRQRKVDTRELLPLNKYDLCIVSFSGGKDSLALVLDLLEQGVPRDRIQLWHQDVDGEPGAPGLMDWPCTRPYVQSIGDALGVRVLFQFRMGGFLSEMLKEEARTQPVRFQRQDGTWGTAGGIKGKIGTRRLFPQPTANLGVRWCTPTLKIDVAAIALNNEPTFKDGRRLLFLTGERREESANRATYAEREPHRCDTKSRRVDAWRSVIDWDEARVWDIIKRWGIIPHPAYRLGFPRVSCMACIFGGPDQWASVRKIAPGRFARIAAYEREFGKTIRQGLSVEQLADRGTPYPACDDAALVALAMGESYPVDKVFLPAGQAWEHPAGAFKHGGGAKLTAFPAETTVISAPGDDRRGPTEGSEGEQVMKLKDIVLVIACRGGAAELVVPAAYGVDLDEPTQGMDLLVERANIEPPYLYMNRADVTLEPALSAVSDGLSRVLVRPPANLEEALADGFVIAILRPVANLEDAASAVARTVDVPGMIYSPVGVVGRCVLVELRKNKRPSRQK